MILEIFFPTKEIMKKINSGTESHFTNSNNFHPTAVSTPGQDKKSLSQTNQSASKKSSPDLVWPCQLQPCPARREAPSLSLRRTLQGDAQEQRG